MFKIIAKMKKALKNKKGFTIIELMAVFAVLAIVAAIAVPRFTGTVDAAKVQTDKASAQIIARAAEQKWLDDGETSAQNYKATDLHTAKYLQKAPEIKAGTATDFYAVVDEKGICQGVYYGESAKGDNLLTDEVETDEVET